jgi:Zn-dependent peptidase ImmA (M78 family)
MSKLNVVGAEPCDGLNASGALLKEGKGLKIVYSSDLAGGRRRWTIAHELGHALFEMTGPRAPRRGRELERMCDMIAAELLMPWDCFGQHVRGGVSAEGILRLARSFQTSVSATAIRCAEVTGVSVFETERRSVRWGYGVVRRNSDIASDDCFRRVVVDAMGSESGSDELLLTFSGRTRRWLLQWKRVGSEERKLFVLQPAF